MDDRYDDRRRNMFDSYEDWYDQPNDRHPYAASPYSDQDSLSSSDAAGAYRMSSENGRTSQPYEPYGTYEGSEEFRSSDTRDSREGYEAYARGSYSSRRTSQRYVESDEGNSAVETFSRADAEEDAISRFRRSEYGTGKAKQSSVELPSDRTRRTASESLQDGESTARPRRRRRGSANSRRHASAAVSENLANDGQFDEGTAPARTMTNPNRKRNIIVAAVVAIAIVLAGALMAFGYVSSISSNLHEGVDQNLKDALVKTNMANEPFYILLLGTDKSAERTESEEFGGAFRSDSMMLARIDPVNKKVAMVSIPRDTLVDLGGNYGWNKINAAYAYGGPSLAVQAVSKLAGVPISHYAEIDFNGFSAMVDALGGVEVEVPLDIDDPDAGGSLKAGLQTLNGEQALILCRSRESYAAISAQPDLMRAANQRMVLSAIAHKLLEADIATIANTVRSVSEYVTTDLELNDIIGIAQTMQGLNSESDMYTATLPTEGAYIVGGYAYADSTLTMPIEPVSPYIDEGWYMIMDEDEWKKMVKRMDQGLPPSEGAVVDPTTGTVLATAGADAEDISDKSCWITVANGTDRTGLGSYVAGLLNDAGYENVTIVDATPGYEYPNTLVVYDEPGRSYEAEKLVEVIGQGKAYLNGGDYIVQNQYLVIVGDDWVGSVPSSSSSSSSGSTANGTSTAQ